MWHSGLNLHRICGLKFMKEERLQRVLERPFLCTHNTIYKFVENVHMLGHVLLFPLRKSIEILISLYVNCCIDIAFRNWAAGIEQFCSYLE